MSDERTSGWYSDETLSPLPSYVRPGGPIDRTVDDDAYEIYPAQTIDRDELRDLILWAMHAGLSTDVSDVWVDRFVALLRPDYTPFTAHYWEQRNAKAEAKLIALEALCNEWDKNGEGIDATARVRAIIKGRP